MPESITIKIKENGPYLISIEDAAAVVIVDAAGVRHLPTPGKAIALCRCGQSSQKPFCDKTHRSVGFHGAVTAGGAQPPSAPTPTAASAESAPSPAPTGTTSGPSGPPSPPIR